MLPKEELMAAVNTAFDEARFRLRCLNDEALAEKFGTSTKTISQIRNGHWTTVDTALITVLVSMLRAPVGEYA